MKNQAAFVLSLMMVGGLTACSAKKEDAPVPRDFDRDVKGTQKLIPGEIDPDRVKNWYTHGPEDGVEGVNAESAYSRGLVSSDSSQEIIVAIIDNGVDIHHEDLRGKIWINSKEAQGRPGVDDDHNGYVDDLNGWNYLGKINADGSYLHLEGETIETVREKIRLTQKKTELESRGERLSSEDELQLRKLTEELAQAKLDAQDMLAQSIETLQKLEAEYLILASKIRVPFKDLTEQQLREFQPAAHEEAAARDLMLAWMQKYKVKAIGRLYLRAEYAKETLEIHLNESLDARTRLVGDRPDDFSDTRYGNPDVKGPNADHGTHVAGIIAAVRDNQLGVRGIAEKVKIMSLRVVPNGDERDKDIALAVRYAADHGAKIINMSFGKRVSPNKKEVDEAFLYAAKKGVLIFHAAGNDSLNTDQAGFFPNRYLRGVLMESFMEIPTWIEVGASTRYKDARLPANFSNYGQNAVDLFAPGLDIESTVPENQYAVYKGTSMACPAAAGSAALIWSARPHLTAVDVRRLLLQQVRVHSSMLVQRPGGNSTDLLPFGVLSRTGGIADVVRALETALITVGHR